jgi:hypothetical protein
MRNRSALLLAAVLAFSVSAPLCAHHGGTTIYADELISLQGTVKTWYWANPHVLLEITVTGEGGQAVDWIFEMQAPNTIRPAGFRKDLLEAGDEVFVEVQPAKNGNRNGRLTRLVLADGTELDPLSYRRGREAQ